MLLERRGTDGTRANNGDLRVGIMGLGVVGSAVRRYFEAQGHRPRLYDPYLALGSRQEIDKARVIFVCVPTLYREHGAEITVGRPTPQRSNGEREYRCRE